MGNTRYNIISSIEDLDVNERTNQSAILWEHARDKGTPLIIQKDDGKYQALFIYSASENDLDIRLESQDLYDRMLSEENTPKKFTKIEGTSIYYLQLDDLPSDACAQYAIQVNGVTVDDPLNKNIIIQKRTDTSILAEEKESGSHVLSIQSSPVTYMMMPEAKLPALINAESVSQVNIDVSNFHSDKYPTFKDRDIFQWKSDPFDPATGKVVFVLDGGEFCQSMSPYLESMYQNTAFVFIDSKISDRVSEFYFGRPAFGTMISEEIIPKYQEILGVTDKENVILVGHSLAAHPIIDIANKIDESGVSTIGGIILASPALNKTPPASLPAEPKEPLKALPIYVQIGKLEDAMPTSIAIENEGAIEKSRLQSAMDFHGSLDNYTSKEFTIHPYGHSGIHVIQAITDGLQFIDQEKLIRSESKCDMRPPSL